MPDNTIYLVTGTNKGIGLALVSHLLQRPNTTVIATFRASSSAPSTSALSSLVPHPSSTLIPLPLPILPIPSTATLTSLLPPSITHLDVVIANAGGTSGFRDVPSTSAQDMRYDFDLNAVGTAELFRVTWPLLECSGKGTKKFVVVSSSVGSIGGLAEENFPATAYGMSKAAANWWARKVGLDFGGRGLAVGVLHPGWVKTGMGTGIADALGIEEGGPGMTAEESAEALLEQIDGLTLENSGEFKSYNGKTLPW
ncbi:NAD(P)-binding protein [Coniochaeta ligniaria NRRL 30616]|uniref:NAD(P)-binding protein n=1 Tax=Coniochaeta ligniaria NRRL 30616 TaxID=1408157 RepID=A0A1J7JGD0_9PEZI|nr:NAD(P)-binding protein [Coniochaeta ligniaria NRRL 30616]